MTSLPLARVLMFVYIRFCSMLITGNLTVQSMGSHKGIRGGIQTPEAQLQPLLSFPAPPPEFPGD